MKVALIGPVFPYRGGIAHFGAMLAREFEKHHDVSLVNFQRLYPSFLFPGKTQFDDSDSPMKVDSERIIDVLNPWTWRAAGRHVAALAPDLVVFQWWHPFFGPAFRAITRAIHRNSRARVVFLCHNVLPHESSVLDRVLSRVGLGSADAYLVQSKQDGANLEQIRPGARWAFNPHPVYDWFEMERFDRSSAREALSVGGRVLLFFGLIRPYKGLDLLLRAFAGVADELDATLLVVGEFYEPRGPYDALIEDLGIGSRVRVVDRYVPNEDVEMYFKAADVAVLPYRTATQSGIVQTAYSFHLPVIVTGVGGLPDVVRDGETGYVVAPEDPEALAGAMRRFYREEAGPRLAEGIRSDLDRFSWRHCVDTLCDLGNGGNG
jgi:glycosyltransferase involved in cell wall biosynthesis